MDVDGSIAPGQDFLRVIEEQVQICEVMLALIGSNWLDSARESGGVTSKIHKISYGGRSA